MSPVVRVGAGALFIVGCSISGEQREDVPPTRRDSTVAEYHGVRVRDPYRWLEDTQAPEVQGWIATQNALTDSVIGNLEEGQVLAKRIEALATTSPDRSSPAIVGSTLFYLRNTPPQPQPVLVAEAWPRGGAARTLVDVNADGGSVAITAYWPSPRGKYLAYTTATGGSELATLRFVDVRSGRALPDSIPFAGGGTSGPAVLWDRDEGGVTFTRFPVPPAGQPVRQFDVSLYHHSLGSGSSPAPVLGQGFTPIAEWSLLSSDAGTGGAALLFTGDGGYADVFRRDGSTWRKVVDQSAGITGATYVGNALFAIATAGSLHGRIVRIGDDGTLTDMIPEDDWGVQGLDPIADGLLVVRVRGPQWKVDHYDLHGRRIRTLKLPESGISIGTVASSSGSSQALITYSGWTLPTQWVRYAGTSGDLERVFQVVPAGDYSHVRAQVIEATSRDGTKVPFTVVSLDTAQRTGDAPTILTGYGGFRAPFGPRFIGTSLAWLERGGVLAYANLRGGNDFGEGWHQGGMKTTKQHTFDDFYAVAQALVADKWSTPDRLGITGGSNGGLLVGAAMTQHPEAYRAVVSFVGIYDMLRHETFPNGAYNVSEYGRTSDSAEFAALYAYSPLHHVKAGTSYPSILMETGLNDPRVASWQSRKFTAALQAASDRPVLLLTRADAGHGIGAPFSQRVGNAAVAMTFFAHELGLPVEPWKR